MLTFMKKSSLFVSSFIIVLSLTGCFGATSFSNRSVVYQVSPTNKGEHSYVSGSPTATSATVNAEKTFESSTKANVAQNLTDTSSNDQHKEIENPKESPIIESK